MILTVSKLKTNNESQGIEKMEGVFSQNIFGQFSQSIGLALFKINHEALPWCLIPLETCCLLEINRYLNQISMHIKDIYQPDTSPLDTYPLGH